MCRLILVVLLLFMINGCGPGGGDSSSANNSGNTNEPSVSTKSSSALEVFAYETQRVVNLSLSIGSEYTSSQKQILLYETQKTINDASTPGDIIVYEALLTEGVSNNNGSYETTLTLGGHIDSIWIIIPAIAYEKRINIINNEIILNITKGS
ncbi:MAG: hypothetical protein COB99_06510 [Sulfurimonas sp.]|nr:MAG: hypothetical protein COB99_06510 [Sulfurimonas sp.]